MMEIEFQKAIPILQKLHEHGYEAYFVGGSVRDHLLNRSIHDVDIATSAMPEEVMKVFPKHVPVGIQHGTVLVLHDNVGYEITTFRIESEYQDFRRPTNVQFVRSLEEDMKRRDFTMNAIAMTVTGEMIDLFHGKEDIAKKVIRTVGEPTERFSEDALRMMRAIRFVSTLGFSIEEQTKHVMIELSSFIAHVSVERITAEFEKLLMGPYVDAVYSLLASTDLGKYLPNMEPYVHKIERLSKYDIDKLTKLTERWALLLLVLEVEDVRQFLKAWRLPTKQTKEIQLIVEEVKAHKCWTELKMYELGEEMTVSVEKVHAVYMRQLSRHKELLRSYESLPIKSKKDLVITGTDLLGWFQKRGGAWVSDYLMQIEKEIINGNLNNNKEEIKRTVLSWEK